jgi:hypothetical protein
VALLKLSEQDEPEIASNGVAVFSVDGLGRAE